MRDRLDSAHRELAVAIAERDNARAKLNEHEERLREAGIEIEWAPKRKRRSR
jgi:hypothetical protein